MDRVQNVPATNLNLRLFIQLRTSAKLELNYFHLYNTSFSILKIIV